MPFPQTATNVPPTFSQPSKQKIKTQVMRPGMMKITCTVCHGFVGLGKKFTEGKSGGFVHVDRPRCRNQALYPSG